MKEVRIEPVLPIRKSGYFWSMTQGRAHSAQAASLAARFLVHGYVVAPGPLSVDDIALLVDVAELAARDPAGARRAAEVGAENLWDPAGAVRPPL